MKPVDILISCYHMASQDPNSDVNGPVYWRAKLGEGKTQSPIRSSTFRSLKCSIFPIGSWRCSSLPSGAYSRG